MRGGAGPALVLLSHTFPNVGFSEFGLEGRRAKVLDFQDLQSI